MAGPRAGGSRAARGRPVRKTEGVASGLASEASPDPEGETRGAGPVAGSRARWSVG